MKENDKSISVIIPYYNNDETVLESIKSVIDQSYKDHISIILINDGSKKNPENIIHNNFDFNTINNRSIKIIHQENKGVAFTRNRGVLESKTDFIAFLDPDDLWSQEKIDKQMRLIKKNNFKMLGTNWNNYSHQFYNKNLEYYKISPFMAAFQWWPHISTILMKREFCIEIGGFDSQFKREEFGDFLLKVAKADSLNILNEDLVTCHVFKEFEFSIGLSSNLKEMNEDEIKTIQIHFSNNKLKKSFLIFYRRLNYIKRLGKRFFLKSKNNFFRKKIK